MTIPIPESRGEWMDISVRWIGYLEADTGYQLWGPDGVGQPSGRAPYILQSIRNNPGNPWVLSWLLMDAIGEDELDDSGSDFHLLLSREIPDILKFAIAHSPPWEESYSSQSYRAEVINLAAWYRYNLTQDPQAQHLDTLIRTYVPDVAGMMVGLSGTGLNYCGWLGTFDPSEGQHEVPELMPVRRAEATSATAYRWLQVAHWEDRETIRRSWRQLAILVHPDRSRGDVGDWTKSEYAQRVNQAFQSVDEPSKRAAYDRELAAKSICYFCGGQPSFGGDPQPHLRGDKALFVPGFIQVDACGDCSDVVTMACLVDQHNRCRGRADGSPPDLPCPCHCHDVS